MKPKVIALAGIVIAASLLIAAIEVIRQSNTLFTPEVKTPDQIAQEEAAVSASKLKPATPLPASPTPTPTPKPLTFAEMNQLYGPCAIVPTLMYHHVQAEAIAKADGHAQLTVDSGWFQKQMQYLKDHNYNVIKANDLINFFDNGTPLPSKPVMLTFDDGYDDFGTDAAPIMSAFGFNSTLFVPTGLMENAGYLHWSTISSLSGPVLMANHTWSHHNMGASKSVIEKEITTADSQLGGRGLNSPKVFAYPYGLTSSYSIAFLQQMGYKLAFTTKHGSTLCKQQRLTLPRIRIGNAQLSSYGL